MGIVLEILLLALFFKMMLFPAYRSTDFEVHRNWLRITYNLPQEKWYYDTRSIWTLDYPPFFAFFEYMLSILSRYVDKNMTHPSNLEYESWNCIVFQRMTVLVCEGLFLYAVFKCFKTKEEGKAAWMKILIINLNFGYILVDDIHFQYNSPLQGILILSIYFAEKGNYILSAMLYMTVLNFKHIFLYCAPAFFFYFLKNYCFEDKINKDGIFRILKLGAAMGSVLVLSFGPFISSFKQILSRMFPFQRGLTHDYWAPNFWALYCTLNRICETFVKKTFNFDIKTSRINECELNFLPDITPFISISFVLLFSCLLAWKFWRSGKKDFMEYCGYQSLVFFAFGFHVHEKAILIPLTLLQISSFRSERNLKKTWLFCFVAGLSLFPLIPDLHEQFAILVIFVIYSYVYLYCISKEKQINLKKNEMMWLVSGFSLILVFICDNFTKKDTFLIRLLISDLSACFNLLFLSAYLMEGKSHKIAKLDKIF